MKVICRNCRWWNGDRDGWGDKTGKCFAIHSSAALANNIDARLFPVGTNAWVESHRDFSCALGEKMRVSKD